MKKKIKDIIKSLPSLSGVYIFKNKKEEIIYIGKAKDIKKRVQSHFRSPTAKNAPAHWADFYDKVDGIDYITTPSEHDALILEDKLIKQHQPRYNVERKDDKGFFYAEFTDEPLARSRLVHYPPRIAAQKLKKNLIGPFVNGKETKQYYRQLRKLFPYRTCKNKPDNPCLYYHLGLCSAHLKKASRYPLVLQGLGALLSLYAGNKPRIECFDISNTQGALSVGSMVVFSGRKPSKRNYRKFKIRTVKGADDPASLHEVISRRLVHNEWGAPDLIIVDGGRTQLSTLRTLPYPIIAIAKAKGHSGTLYSSFSRSSVLLDDLPREVRDTILALRDEAHRFAISYHRTRHHKHILPQ